MASKIQVLETEQRHLKEKDHQKINLRSFQALAHEIDNET
jgi:hypothetical protein